MPASTGPQHAQTFREDIEGLRGVSIAAVLLFHLNRNWLPGGYLGVDVFFVISGYVVATASAVRTHLPVRAFCLDFYKRRMRRLLPPLLTTAAVTAVTAILLLPPSTNKLDVLRTAGFAAADVGNLYLAAQAADYWHDAVTPNAFLHSWSLGVEEQFYLLFPLLFIYLVRDSWPARAATVLLIIVSAIVGFSWWASDPIAAFYLLPARLWEPLLGVWLFLALRRVDVEAVVQWRWFRPIAKALQIAAIVSLIVLFTRDESFAQGAAAQSLACAAAVILIALGKPLARMNARQLLATRGLRLLGRVSYSAYLTHWPIITIYSLVFGLVGAGDYLLVLTLVVCATLALHVFVERPCLGPKRERVSVPLLLAIQVASLVLVLNPRAIEASAAFSMDLWHVDRWSLGNEWQAVLESDVVADHDMAQRLSQQHIQRLETFRTTDSKPIAANVRTLFGLGNSYLMSSMPMLIEFASRNGYRFEAHQVMNCAWHGDFLCQEAIGDFVGQVEATATPGSVIYVAVRYSSTQGGPFFERLLPQLAALSARKGLTLVVQGPVPRFAGFSPRACFSPIRVARHEMCRPSVPVASSGVDAAELVSGALRQVVTSSPSVAIFSPWSQLCDDVTCTRGAAGRYFFMDEDHLSVRGSLHLLGGFEEFMRSLPAAPGS